MEPWRRDSACFASGINLYSPACADRADARARARYTGGIRDNDAATSGPCRRRSVSAPEKRYIQHDSGPSSIRFDNLRGRVWDLFRLFALAPCLSHSFRATIGVRTVRIRSGNWLIPWSLFDTLYVRCQLATTIHDVAATRTCEECTCACRLFGRVSVDARRNATAR